MLGNCSQRVLLEGRVCKNTLKVVHFTQPKSVSQYNINMHKRINLQNKYKHIELI